MKKIYSLVIILSLIISVISFSCYSVVYKITLPGLHDGKYDTQFSYYDASEQLKEISRSVKLISCTAIYENYIFSRNSNFKLSEINASVLRLRSIKENQNEQTVAGTGTIIYAGSHSVALLTCAHLVNFPDTIVTYFANSSDEPTKYIESISIKIKQFNFVPELPEFGEFQILLMNPKIDVAIIGKRIKQKVSKILPVFSYPNGSAKELEWGSFVYAIGYPFNYKMLTSGIVSKSYEEKDGTFLINTVINRGFSGGIVLAIRDGVPNFELVGIILSIISENNYYLKPQYSIDSVQYSDNARYSGEIRVGELKQIRYGLTRVLPIETILSYLNKKQKILEAEGYDLTSFLTRQSKAN